MLVGPSGDSVGSVSGGCVEGAVYDLSQSVVESGEPVLERYGVSDDDAFAVGLTCGGILDVFVERVNRETFPELGSACTTGVGACAATGVTVCSADGLGTGCDAVAGEPRSEGPFGDPSCGNASDDDCDGAADEADPDCALSCTDGDGDGFAIEGGECGSVDCDDANAAVNPGQSEVPGNGVDDDCDPATPPQTGCAPQPQSAVAAVGGERIATPFVLDLGPWIGALALVIRGVRRRALPAGRAARAA